MVYAFIFNLKINSLISNFKFQISNSEKGITLVEIIVVIFIIAIFSLILIADFPEIQKQYALSGATYKLAQDFRRAQDLGLSAVQLTDKNNDPIMVKGYGIYVNLSLSETQYIIYADVGALPDQEYNGDFSNTLLCSNQKGSASDCIIDIIDVSQQNKNINIKAIKEESNFITGASINFMPPDPIINITDVTDADDNSYAEIGIVLGIRTGSGERAVFVNKSGLINVQ